MKQSHARWGVGLPWEVLAYLPRKKGAAWRWGEKGEAESETVLQKCERGAGGSLQHTKKPKPVQNRPKPGLRAALLPSHLQGLHSGLGSTWRGEGVGGSPVGQRAIS